MKALSIRQPWAWAILHAGKRVENRAWSLASGNASQARALVGSTILIHAAKGCTRDEYEDASYAIDLAVFRQDLAPPLSALPRGAIVARARLVDVARTWGVGHRTEPSPHGKSTCKLCGERATLTLCPKADPWGIPGALGLILADVVPLATPIPFKGALGFFDVPDALLEGAM